MMDTDFIVCGAGPAGSTAARFLAAKGHSVVLIDNDDFPRDKPCGGGLCPHILDFDYVRQDIEEYLESECYRGMIFSPSLKNSIDYRSDTPLFYNIRRKVFDHKLVQYAKQEGAEFHKGHVKKVKEDEQNVMVELFDGTVLHSKAVIGATGPHDVTARYIRSKYELPLNWSDDEIGTILVHEFDVPRDFIDDAYGEERTSIIYLQTAGLLHGGYGYGWVFSKSDVLNIGYGAFKCDMVRINMKKTFSQYLNVLKEGGHFPVNKQLEEFRGAPLPLQGFIPKTFYNRMIIAGDSAGFVSPLTGEGIYYAMDSGRMAAEVLDRASTRNDFTTNSLSEYQRLWKKAWGKDLTMLKMFANRLMAWPEAIIRYAKQDPVLREYFVSIFISSESAHRLKGKIAGRLAKNFIMRR